VQEQDLAPIKEPDIDLEQVEDGKPLIFTAVVEVRPRLELDDWKGVKVEKPSVEVTDADIDEWIDRLRDRFAELEPVSHPATTGDFVVADIRTTANDDEVAEATRTDHLYEIGSAEFGDALDKELTGKRPGDIVKAIGPLPERFEDRADTNVSFSAVVKEVKAKRLPEADDDFAKTASEFDTLDELKADLREKLGELKEREAAAAVRDLVLETMIDRVDVDIPESLIDEETEHRVVHARERAERAGLSLDQLLEAQGWDEARLRQDAQQHALRAVKSDLVLEGVARAEKLEVTAEEIGAEINALAQVYGREPKDLAKQLDRTGQIVTLAGDIIRTKALDLLVEHADIQDGHPEPIENEAKAVQPDATGEEPAATKSEEKT